MLVSHPLHRNPARTAVDSARRVAREARGSLKGQQTKAAIVDAALRLASQVGLEGLSIGAVAEMPIEPNTRPVSWPLPAGSDAGSRALETQPAASMAAARQNDGNSARQDGIGNLPGMQRPYRIGAAAAA